MNDNAEQSEALYERLRNDLDRLQAEIDNLDAGEAGLQRLEQLKVNIYEELKLLRLGQSTDDLGSEIEDVIRELEVRHPTATAILNSIMQALANMGV